MSSATKKEISIYQDESLLCAIHDHYAVIEFTPDGHIIDANDNFFSAMGYQKDEVVGQHHRMFCEPGYAESFEYKQFWKELSEGKAKIGEFKRFTKDKEMVWLSASYTPIYNNKNEVIKVVKFAQNKTEQILQAFDQKGKVNAIGRAQAVIEFNLDGTILDANENFCQAVGYSLDEIKGQHHRIFCDPEYTETQEYKEFWNKLGKGEFHSGEYKRFSKDGQEVWINATYNPIFDGEGNPVKVVKFATDITEEKLKRCDYEGKIQAIDRSQAVIEFDLDGTILRANENFCNTVGYKLEEIVGQHHRIFCDPQYVQTPEYHNFWAKLGSGVFDSGEYKRFTKDGKEVWINASYNPVLDAEGRPMKVVKFASDITEQKEKSSDYESKIEAINRSQATIEFDLSGNIIWANDNFCKTVGYDLEEIIGKHHRIFCDPEYTNTSEYRVFWEKLGKGQFDSGEYKRFDKNGKEVWINASYNPVLDAEGKPVKIVKYASDITEQKLKSTDYESKINAINRSQAAIEFNLDGTIIWANENFCQTLGYSLEEIKGKHHRIFCDPEYTQSNEYKNFWEKLGRGEFESGEYKRFGQGGKEVWINASYNPLFDADGNVVKVVKYATDLTKEKVAYNNLVNSFEEAAEKVLSASNELTLTAKEMNESAEKTMKESHAAASAAEQVKMGINSVGASMEEMQASIKEISNSALEGSNKSLEAKDKSSETNQLMSALNQSSEEIGAVIKMISSIAQQTNLLALNATIEAARAGEAGKGFAVVANEVKELAKQTGTATSEISAQIGNVQNSTTNSVRGIEDIVDLINKMSDISSSTAAAVEEQSAATAEVNRIVNESSIGVENISQTIQVVADVSQRNTEGASSTLASANQLKELSEGLIKLVEAAKAS